MTMLSLIVCRSGVVGLHVYTLLENSNIVPGFWTKCHRQSFECSFIQRGIKYDPSQCTLLLQTSLSMHIV